MSTVSGFRHDLTRSDGIVRTGAVVSSSAPAAVAGRRRRAWRRRRWRPTGPAPRHVAGRRRPTNRQGRSAAAEMPDPGGRPAGRRAVASRRRPARRRASAGRPGRRRRSARSIPRAWHSRPGPRHRSRSSGGAGRASGPRASASRPATGARARSSTAWAVPGRAADDVGAPVHAVAEVDVEVAGRAEHDRGCGPSGPGRRGWPGPRRRGRPRPRRSGPTRPSAVTSSLLSSRGATLERRRRRRRRSPVTATAAPAVGTAVGESPAVAGQRRRGRAPLAVAGRRGEALELHGHRRRARPRRAWSAGSRPRPGSSSATASAPRAGWACDQLGQRDVALDGVAHQAADHGVGLAERHAPLDQPLGQVDRGRGRARRRPRACASVFEGRRWPAARSWPPRPAADLVDRVEQRLLVLLEVAVVGQRQALERGQQPGQVADQPARPCPGPARRRRGSSSAGSIELPVA